MSSNFPAKKIARSAVVAAMYFALSVALQPIAFGPVQFRISEALVLLPILMPETIWGLAVGCFFSNMFFSPFGWLDAVIGTVATLIAAFLSAKIKKPFLAAIPPVVLNALLVPLIWIFNKTDTLYYINMLSILASETIVVFGIALPLVYILKKGVPERFFK